VLRICQEKELTLLQLCYLHLPDKYERVLLLKKILKIAEECTCIDRCMYVIAYRTHDIWIKNEFHSSGWVYPKESIS
jgi:hypothetical protein